MKVNSLLGFLFLFILISCNENRNKTEVVSVDSIKKNILLYEDSIVSFQKSQKQVPQRFQDSLISNLLRFYSKYPKDKSAAKCLDKIQMYYSGNGFYLNAVKYSDILIKDYPNYENRALVIEAQAVNYDMFVNPRDTNKIKYFFNLLLKENPSMEKEKKQGIELRLKHLNLTFDEFVQFQASNLKKKN